MEAKPNQLISSWIKKILQVGQMENFIKMEVKSSMYQY